MTAPQPARRAWRVAFAVAVVAHFLALYWPRIDVPNAPGGGDKLGHLLLFGVPAALAVSGLARAWPFLVLLAVHAPLSEWLQASWLPDRSGDPVDAVVDLLGLGLGVWMGRWLGHGKESDRSLVN